MTTVVPSPAQRTVLLVGGAGYIGTVLAWHLLEQGYQVRVLDALIYGHHHAVAPFLGHPRFGFVRGDLCDEATVVASLDGVTDVVLLAGLVGDPVTKKFPDAARAVNEEGYLRLVPLLRARGLRNVVFASTCSNYGRIPNDRAAGEDHVLMPLSLYARTKVATESLFLTPNPAVDYVPTVLRFATAFGLSPRMRFDLTVNEFTRLMYLGEELVVYDADTWRPYCHVQDFARLIRMVLEAPVDAVAFEVFNAGGDANNFTKRMLVDAIRERLPSAPVRFQEHGEDPRNYRVDFTRVRERLGFEPAYTVRHGIRELVEALDAGFFRVTGPVYGNYQLVSKGA